MGLRTLLLGKPTVAAPARRNQAPEARYSGYPLSYLDNWFSFDGINYPVVASSDQGPYSDRERPDNTFIGYVRGAYKSDSIVFACMLARAMIFSEARFMYQRLNEGRPGELYSTRALRILERPWPNGTTGELLSRMIQDVDLSGNFYAVRDGNRIRRLRPDWVEIVLTAPPAEAVSSDVAGYMYRPGGPASEADPVFYLPEEIVHWSPIPDPEKQYRGMSWLTPALREIQADLEATRHKLSFFQNGATLSFAVSFKESVTKDQFQAFMRAFKESHQGVRNAYEPLFLGAGADITPIGTDLNQIDFKRTQGAGETRIAADSGIHPVILGISEGLAGSSLNQGNFNAARRLTADKTLRPLWRSAAAVLESLVIVPASSRLWYDDRDIPFLREDRADLADIQGREASSIRQLVDAGFEPKSITSAIDEQDWDLLEHTGLFSVQLQPPGTTAQADEAIAEEEAAPQTNPEDDDEDQTPAEEGDA
jgi:phage portal protein BeeE